MRNDELHVFLGDARADTAVDTRRRRRWLARQLDEDRTFEEVCARAVRDGTSADVTVVGGRTHRGRLLAAPAGMITVAAADGGVAYITGAAVVGLRLRPHGAAFGHLPVTATGHPFPVAATRVGGATIGDVVRDLADRHVTVGIGTVDGRVHRGRIEGVGRDVLRLEGGTHLRLDMVTDVSAIS